MNVNFLKKIYYEKYSKKSYSISNVDLIITEYTDINQGKLETYTQLLDYIINTNIYKLLEKNEYKIINWVN